MSAGKECRKCHETKPRAEFHRNAKAKDGLQATCRMCTSAYQKEYAKRATRSFSARYQLRSPLWVKQMARNAMLRARRLKLPFDRDAVEECLKAAPDTCPALGSRFVVGGQGSVTSLSPTLDRIRASDGYVRGNLQVLSMKANQIKTDATPEEVLAVARFMRRKV